MSSRIKSDRARSESTLEKRRFRRPVPPATPSRTMAPTTTPQERTRRQPVPVAGAFIETPQHLRPQVASQLAFHGPQGLLQQVSDFLLFFFIHGLYPGFLISCAILRIARNSLDLTAAVEIFSASAISPCGHCSISASVATTRSLAGNCWKASWVRSRISRWIAGLSTRGSCRGFWR